MMKALLENVFGLGARRADGLGARCADGQIAHCDATAPAPGTATVPSAGTAPSLARCAAFALALAATFAATLVASLMCPPLALADESSAQENEVDVSQLPDSSFIYDTSIIDLSTADSYYDKQTVQVTGEVIGDKILVDADDDHCWITLSASGSTTVTTLLSSTASTAVNAQTDAQISKASSIATTTVYMTKTAAEKIDLFGRYGQKGTTLQVRGTFHLACAEHSGVSDIHAQVITVTQKGKVTPDPFDPVKFVPGIIAIAVGLALMVLFRWLQERQR